MLQYELTGMPIKENYSILGDLSMNLDLLQHYAAQEANVVLLVPSTDASSIETGFEKYLIDKDSKVLCSYLEAGLHKLISKSFHITIVNNDRKEPFFAMRVFPDVMWIEDTCRRIISNDKVALLDIYQAWSDIPKWEIEIDAQIFNRFELTLNPKELTAILLHEIGHVLMSGEPVERFYRTFLECQLMSKSDIRPIQKALYFIYSLALSVSCLQKSYMSKHDGIKIELKADRYVLTKGYGEYLISALDKIVRAYGCSLTGGSPDVNRMDSELKENILWCNLNIINLTVRRNEIAKQIHVRVSRRTNGYFKNLGADIIKKVGFIPKDKFSNVHDAFATESISSFIEMETDEFATQYEWVPYFEQYVKITGSIQSYQHSYDAAMEAFSPDIRKMMPSQYDIDCIGVEIDRIETQSDRIYVLDLIYANLDKIQKCRDKMNKYTTLQTYSTQLDDMERQLTDYRKMVLAIHDLGKDYKFFVKYPKGYEG